MNMKLSLYNLRERESVRERRYIKSHERKQKKNGPTYGIKNEVRSVENSISSIFSGKFDESPNQFSAFCVFALNPSMYLYI